MKIKKLVWSELEPGREYFTTMDDISISSEDGVNWSIHPTNWPNMSDEYPFGSKQAAIDAAQDMFEMRVRSYIEEE